MTEIREEAPMDYRELESEVTETGEIDKKSELEFNTCRDEMANLFPHLRISRAS